jgi:hypothetical protein
MGKEHEVPMMARGLNSKKEDSEREEVREERLERTYYAQEDRGGAVEKPESQGSLLSTSNRERRNARMGNPFLAKEHLENTTWTTSSTVPQTEKVQGHDIQTDLGYHRVSPDHISMDQDVPVKTIMDESLGDVFDKTLSFTANSMDSYMRKVYEAETLLDTDRKNPSFQDSMMKYLVGFGLFIRDEGNAVYLGLVCILVSIIIYSLDITTS